MDSTSKCFSLLLIVAIAASSLMMAEPEHVSAQTTTATPQVTPSSNPTSNLTPTPPIPTLIPTPTPIYPKPSVPELTIKLVSLLPEANKSAIELTIKNQPFDSNYSLFYNVTTRINGGNWKQVYNIEDGYPTQSNSDYTILSYSSSDDSSGYFIDTSTSHLYTFSIYAPVNSSLDVQVQAMIGTRHRGAFSGGIMPYVFSGETSNWSKLQKINISDASASPNPTPSVPEFSSLSILLLVLVATVTSLLLYRRHRKPTSLSK
jgi:hypothetical protein